MRFRSVATGLAATALLAACTGAPSTVANTPSSSSSPGTPGTQPPASTTPGAALALSLKVDGKEVTMSKEASYTRSSAGFQEISAGSSNTDYRVTLTVGTKNREFNDPAFNVGTDLVSARLAVVTVQGGMTSWQYTWTSNFPAMFERVDGKLNLTYKGKLTVFLGGGQGEVDMTLKGLPLK